MSKKKLSTLRKPTAPPSKRHKSKKDYNRDSGIKSYRCYKCDSQFFTYLIEEGKQPTCIDCWDWREENA